MCQCKYKLNYYMKDYKKRSDTLTKKEQDVMKDMKIVQEMYARGFDFVPVDGSLAVDGAHSYYDPLCVLRRYK